MARFRTIRTVSISVLSVLLILLLNAVIVGCGSGGGSSPLVIDSQQNSSGAASGSASANSTQGCTTSTYVPNFATDTDPVTNQPNRLYHWTSFPLRVYFVSSALSTPDRQAQALAGFDWWVTGTNHMVSYTVVSVPSQANITVQFQAQGKTNYGAITDYHTGSGNTMRDATITFNMTYLSSISSITPIAAHEFGHALGIGGHSRDNNDVMAESPNVYQRTQLTVRDINTLLTAYCGGSLIDSGRGAQSGSTQTDQVRCRIGAGQ